MPGSSARWSLAWWASVSWASVGWPLGRVALGLVGPGQVGPHHHSPSVRNHPGERPVVHKLVFSWDWPWVQNPGSWVEK